MLISDYAGYISDRLSKEKEKYKYICDDLDSTFSELTGYWTSSRALASAPDRSHLIEIASSRLQTIIV